MSAEHPAELTDTTLQEGLNMQAIKTKYCGPTNSRGSRIQASCDAETIYVPYDYALNSDENHRAACEKLLRVLGWTADKSSHFTDMVGGEHGDDMYWVFVNERNRTNVNSASEVAA